MQCPLPRSSPQITFPSIALHSSMLAQTGCPQALAARQQLEARRASHPLASCSYSTEAPTSSLSRSLLRRKASSTSRLQSSSNGAYPPAATKLPPKKPSASMPSLPFTKIAAQDDMKLALLLNVVDPTCGGVLIMGDRGTGKSVAVRAMVELLPEIEVVAEDPFNSHPSDMQLMGPDVRAKALSGEQLAVTRIKTPLVELPLGATEDRICGTINVEKALQEGLKAYDPGLLARANRGILYVDEVNLLDDSLVDVVLDSAASGVNTVEREGISITHPARFIMIGSGNPQEGEMRPQLLDRFGLSVNVTTMQNVAARTQMVIDRLAFEQNPDEFCAACEEEQFVLRGKLQAGSARLPSVVMPRDVRLKISEICSLLDVDGIRGDITVNKAALALAALEERSEVSMTDVARVIGLCLNHRLRKDPLEQIDQGTKVALAFQRVTNPKRAAEEAAKKKAEEEAAKKEAGKKKPGSWGGLPF